MRRTSVFAGFFVLLQLVAPLQYYTVRDDPNDERFSWRMFSAAHMVHCDLQLRAGDPPLPIELKSRFHAAWIELARRGRYSVIEAMARNLCDVRPPVELELSCRILDGSWTAHAVGDFCSEGPPWDRE